MRRRTIKKPCKKGYRKVTISFLTNAGKRVKFEICKKRPTIRRKIKYRR